jgi:hypothetical protein
MRASMAYFSGAGTVIVAVAAGLSGGLLISDIVSPSGTRPPNKLEQRAGTQQALPSPQPPPNTSVTASAPQAPVPYLAATQTATTTAAFAPGPSNSPQPEMPSSNAAPPAAKTDAAVSTDATKPAQAQSTQSPAQQSSHDQNSSPDNAHAKAHEAELTQVVEKKAERPERRQQWATRRSQEREQDWSHRHDRDARDVERYAPDESGARDVIVRGHDRNRGDFFGRPMRSDTDREDFDRPRRFDFPGINLFGPN